MENPKFMKKNKLPCSPGKPVCSSSIHVSKLVRHNHIEISRATTI